MSASPRQIWHYCKGWCRTNVVSDHPVAVLFKGEQITLSPDQMMWVNTVDPTKTHNMTDLVHLHEPAVLQNICQRYQNDMIYTLCGETLLVVNPMKHLPIYDTSHISDHYSAGLLGGEASDSSPSPHIFGASNRAYRRMVDGRDQTILVSGESGAGKTESSKHVMRFLAQVVRQAAHSDTVSISDKILLCNPVLEAFGNATTARNNNSSRFGKFIKIQFDDRYRIVGAEITTYLLERVRTTRQNQGEKNFHIFNQLTESSPNTDACSTPATPETRDFDETLAAMLSLGFSTDEIQHTQDAVRMVRILGEVAVFDIRDPALVTFSSIAGCSTQQFLDAVTTKMRVIAGETILTPLTHEQSCAVRDSVAMYMYENLFAWIVARLNRTLVGTSRKSAKRFIGILDIFGFEVFLKNSLEQFTINYANEKLQHQFNEHVFASEQRIYQTEGIDWTSVSYPDNSGVLELIEGSPVGIMALIDEQGRIGSGTDSALHSMVCRTHDSHPAFHATPTNRAAVCFGVRHYAGLVVYDTQSFCIKNRGATSDRMVDLIRRGANQWLGQMCGAAEIEKRSLVGVFKSQLNELLRVINDTDPIYVRCIKPNDTHEPDRLDRDRVLEQLRYSGVLESVQVARSGYPTRFLLDMFCVQYRVLGASVADIVLSANLSSPDDYQLGATKVFLRQPAYDALESRKVLVTTVYIVKIQAQARVLVARVRFGAKLRACVEVQRVVRGNQCRSTFVRALRGLIQIQRTYLSKRSRASFLAARRAAVKIQSVLRMFRQRNVTGCSLRRNRIRAQQRLVRDLTNIVAKVVAGRVVSVASRVHIFQRTWRKNRERARRRFDAVAVGEKRRTWITAKSRMDTVASARSGMDEMSLSLETFGRELSRFGETVVEGVEALQQNSVDLKKTHASRETELVNERDAAVCLAGTKSAEVEKLIAALSQSSHIKLALAKRLEEIIVENAMLHRSMEIALG